MTRAKKKSTSPLTAAQLATVTGGGLLSIPLTGFRSTETADKTGSVDADWNEQFRGSWVE